MNVYLLAKIGPKTINIATIEGILVKSLRRFLIIIIHILYITKYMKYIWYIKSIVFLHENIFI